MRVVKVIEPSNKVEYKQNTVYLTNGETEIAKLEWFQLNITKFRDIAVYKILDIIYIW